VDNKLIIMPKVNIEEYPITLVATTLEFRIVDTTDTVANVYYCLRRVDGRVAEEGNKDIPISALAILAQQPMNITALNTLLYAGWGITATDQILPE
jgi:hypothetical protein